MRQNDDDDYDDGDDDDSDASVFTRPIPKTLHTQ